jgi:hypothetical protein
MRDIAAATMPPLTRRQSVRHADRSPEADPSKHALKDAKKTPSLLALPPELQNAKCNCGLRRSLCHSSSLSRTRDALTYNLPVASTLGHEKSLPCFKRNSCPYAALPLPRCCPTGQHFKQHVCVNIHPDAPRVDTHSHSPNQGKLGVGRLFCG